MTTALVRGIAQLTAAVSGMLFLFGFVRDMGGLFQVFTTLQIAETVAFMLPWTLLLCSAFHDLSKAASQEWIFWAGSLLIFGVFFHVDRYEPNTISTRVAMSALACAGAMLPHVFRRLSFIYSVLCIVAGLVGIYTLYSFVRTFSRDLYAHDPSAAVYQSVFSAACITAGGFTTAALIYRARSLKAQAQP
jgi:hypothetical protein